MSIVCHPAGASECRIVCQPQEQASVVVCHPAGASEASECRESLLGRLLARITPGGLSRDRVPLARYRSYHSPCQIAGGDRGSEPKDNARASATAPKRIATLS